MSWPSFDFAGKHVLVTGASRGIGQECAIAFARAGADVVITGRDESALADTAAGILEAGRKAWWIAADLADAEQLEALGARAVTETGGIDILINNAGVSFPEPAAETSLHNWDTTLAVNLRAPLFLAKAVFASMVAHGGGSIVNVASAAAHGGLRDHAAYCASKGGLILLTQTLAVEWAAHNIRVNAVSPTVVLTPMGERVWGEPAKRDPMLAKIPLGRFGYPPDVSAAVLFLCSEAASMITGTSLVIDGGYGAQ